MSTARARQGGAPPASPALRRGLAAFFSGVILLGLAMLWGFFGDLARRDYRVAKHYREAQARILDLHMETHAGQWERNFFRPRTRRTTSIPVFTFRFEVDGREVTAAGYDSFRGKDATFAEYSRFRVGETYPCWYDPADPRQAVLVRAWRPQRYWPAAIPLGFIFVAAIFLRGIAGGPPPNVREMPETLPPPVARRASSLPWKLFLVGGGIVGLLVLTVVVPIIAQQKKRGTYAQVGGARHDGPKTLAALGLPPETNATGFRGFEEGPKRLSAQEPDAAWLAWTQPYDSSRDFAQVVAWYGERLGRDAWKVHRAADMTSAEFCQAPWMLRLKRMAEKGAGCRYELRLEWNNKAVPCTHP